MTENIKLTKLDYFLATLSILFLILSWCYVIFYYNELPETIATHFDDSKPDGYNSKNSIWLAPALFSFLSIWTLYGAKYPKALDFSKQIKNNEQAKASSKLLLFSSLLLSIILSTIVYSMINASLPNGKSYQWTFIVNIGLILAYLVIAVRYQSKIKKQ